MKYVSRRRVRFGVGVPPSRRIVFTGVIGKRKSRQLVFDSPVSCLFTVSSSGAEPVNLRLDRLAQPTGVSRHGGVENSSSRAKGATLGRETVPAETPTVGLVSRNLLAPREHNTLRRLFCEGFRNPYHYRLFPFTRTWRGLTVVIRRPSTTLVMNRVTVTLAICCAWDYFLR